MNIRHGQEVRMEMILISIMSIISRMRIMSTRPKISKINSITRSNKAEGNKLDNDAKPWRPYILSLAFGLDDLNIIPP
jgi:hypothetical protein